MTTSKPSKILLTGCNTGIGLGLAKELLRQGHFLIACCRSNEYFSLLHAEFENFKGKFDLYSFDLDTDFTDSLKQIREIHGIPDVIINNAGVYPRAGDHSIESSWQAIELGMRINLKAPMRICEFFKTEMRTLPWGRVINVSSKMGSLGDNRSGGSLAYRNSKLAINLYSVNLAHEMNDSNIKVFCVHPGWIQTRMGGMHAPDKVEQAVDRILFCLTNEASKLHGQFIIGNQVIPW